LSSDIQSVRIGEISITCLPDGAANIDGHPYREDTDSGEEVDWSWYHHKFPNDFHGDSHNWRIHNNCFLIQTNETNILVDTGVGVGPYPRYKNMHGTLMQSLGAVGVSVTEINYVVMTHAHPDHVAWNVDAEGSPYFPNAHYLLHQKDWDEFTGRKPVPPFFVRFVEPLKEIGLLRLISGNVEIAPGVTCLETPGHTPGSVSIRISSQGEYLYVTGDVIVSPFYVFEPSRAFHSDLNSREGISTRIQLIEEVVEHTGLIASAHIGSSGIGSVLLNGGNYEFRPLFR